jgi:hypothetical protein
MQMTSRNVDAMCKRHAPRPGLFPLHHSRLTSRVARVSSNPRPHVTHTRPTSQQRHERRMVKCRGQPPSPHSRSPRWRKATLSSVLLTFMPPSTIPSFMLPIFPARKPSHKSPVRLSSAVHYFDVKFIGVSQVE